MQKTISYYGKIFTFFTYSTIMQNFLLGYHSIHNVKEKVEHSTVESIASGKLCVPWFIVSTHNVGFQLLNIDLHRCIHTVIIRF